MTYLREGGRNISHQFSFSRIEEAMKATSAPKGLQNIMTFPYNFLPDWKLLWFYHIAGVIDFNMVGGKVFQTSIRDLHI